MANVAKKLSKLPNRQTSANSESSKRSDVNVWSTVSSESGESSATSSRVRKPSAWSTVAKRLLAQKTQEKTVVKKHFENTFKTSPDTYFDTKKVKECVEETLYLRLKNETYNSKCGNLCASLAEIIKARVKELGFTRHKLVVYLVIGPMQEQGIKVASRCVWDVNYDNFISVQFSNKHMYAVASVFAVYFD
ncbi:tctex1 domain-containing protein 1-like [Anneissia japonica]|uniref:tctex1 domain-containing protein 1-like n=1 Tax=Anneissia japonica TaxID=1529436 RepID=UPI001425A9AB|nr:tctex1 domain-containing protein 1-like [Anneissia japonica]